MTAGSAFIIGLMFFNAKVMIIGTEWGDIRKAIEESYPGFFKELPTGYERYINSIDTTELMVYLSNAAGAGSVVHMRAFVNLFPMFVEEVYVDDKDLDLFVRSNYRVFGFDELTVYSKYFSKKDQQRYLNRIYPMSERYN